MRVTLDSSIVVFLAKVMLRLIHLNLVCVSVNIFRQACVY